MSDSASPRIGFETADRFLKKMNSPFKDVQDSALDRSLDVEVENSDRMLLADAVNAPDPLLDAHWIPRQIVVNQDVSELEIATFSARFGRY